MLKYKTTMEVEVIADWASIKDLELELDLFNRTNQGVIQIKDIKFTPIEAEDEIP